MFGKIQSAYPRDGLIDGHRDIPLEEFEYTLNVNLRASFVLVKGVVEGMKAQKWGRIIFMSSIAGRGGGINGCRKYREGSIGKNSLTFLEIMQRTYTQSHTPICL